MTRKVFLLILFLYYSAHAFSEELRFLEYPPKKIPEIPLYSITGKAQSLETLDGNVVVLHFWATWCPTCDNQMIALNSLQKFLRKEPIIIIPISEDFKGPDVVKEFYRNKNIKFLPSFYDLNNRWFKEMEVTSLPTTIIIDSIGRNVARFNGSVDWSLESSVDLLKKYIVTKQDANKDYISMLEEYGVKDEEPQKIRMIPEEAHTQVQIDEEISKERQEIYATSPKTQEQEGDLQQRRKVE